MPADFDNMVDLLVAANLPLDPAEFQGMMLGRLSAAANSMLPEHLDALLEECPVRPADEQIQFLSTLVSDTSEALESGDFELSLLLPADIAGFPARLEAIAAWCRGYVYGLGIGEIGESALKDKDLSDILDDVRAISQVGLTEDDSEEEQEEAYTEITEYLKLVPHMVYITMRRQEPAEDSEDATD